MDPLRPFLNDPELLAWYLSTSGCKSTSSEENKRRLYVLAKLESHEDSFLSHASGLLADEVWAAFRTVMVHDFVIDEYQEVWPVAKNFFRTLLRDVRGQRDSSYRGEGAQASRVHTAGSGCASSMTA